MPVYTFSIRKSDSNFWTNISIFNTWAGAIFAAFLCEDEWMITRPIKKGNPGDLLLIAKSIGKDDIFFNVNAIVQNL